MQAIVNQTCGGCHQDGGIAQGTADFSTYDRVHLEAGRMLGQLNGCTMPLADAAQPTTEQRQALLEWLVCRAPDN